MKNTTRFILGLLASLLLTIGFARAAEVVLPIDLKQSVDVAATGDQKGVPTPDCGIPCSW